MEINDDKYKMVSGTSQGEYKEKGSKFIAYACPITDLDQMEQHLLELKKIHPKSRHICYAYRLGFDGNVFRANDDGEPSGTAGRPILGTIDSFEVTNSLIAVIRYFGGTKLGASGLIQAYRSAAQDAMTNAEIIEKTITEKYIIHFDYAHLGIVMNTIKSLEINISALVTESSPYLEVEFPKSQIQHNIDSIKAEILQRPIEDIKHDTEIDYLKIEPL
jgi:uncharacterized YigZ family protein